jgi:hypothetical protein
MSNFYFKKKPLIINKERKYEKNTADFNGIPFKITFMHSQNHTQSKNAIKPYKKHQIFTNNQ